MIDIKELNPLGNTAVGMSYIRGKESLREEPLFYDKLAVEIFKMKNEDLDAEKSPDDSYIVIRTKFFDDAVSRILAGTDIEQVVTLGIGLDIRFHRLNFKKKLTVFEVDQPEVIRFRKEYIPRLSFNTDHNYVQIPLVFSEEKALMEKLENKGFNKTKKTLWVLEGLLYYLNRNEVERLIDEISHLSANESKILCDGINSVFLESKFTEAWISQMRKEGRGWYFGTDDYDEFFRQFGWEASLTQPGDDNASYGRWKYKVLPKILNNVPRYFFIEAVK